MATRSPPLATGGRSARVGEPGVGSNRWSAGRGRSRRSPLDRELDETGPIRGIHPVRARIVSASAVAGGGGRQRRFETSYACRRKMQNPDRRTARNSSQRADFLSGCVSRVNVRAAASIPARRAPRPVRRRAPRRQGRGPPPRLARRGAVLLHEAAVTLESRHRHRPKGAPIPRLMTTEGMIRVSPGSRVNVLLGVSGVRA
jgi:hypothetical protein